MAKKKNTKKTSRNPLIKLAKERQEELGGMFIDDRIIEEKYEKFTAEFSAAIPIPSYGAFIFLEVAPHRVHTFFRSSKQLFELIFVTQSFMVSKATFFKGTVYYGPAYSREYVSNNTRNLAKVLSQMLSFTILDDQLNDFTDL